MSRVGALESRDSKHLYTISSQDLEPFTPLKAKAQEEDQQNKGDQENKGDQQKRLAETSNLGATGLLVMLITGVGWALGYAIADVWKARHR